MLKENLMTQTESGFSIASIHEGVNSLLFDLNGRLWELFEYAEQARQEAEKVLAEGAVSVEAELREALAALTETLSKTNEIKGTLSKQSFAVMGEIVVTLGNQVNAVIQALMKTKA